MDLEHLTKHQIVLLTLLVSFITSIATGIVTVSLMDQAPAGVTRVVNQIVERTVETVVPATQGAATATVTEKTVVVKDDDLATQSIAAVQKGIVRIVGKDGNTLLTRGVIISAEGGVLTDREALRASGEKAFEAILPSGERVPLVFVNEKDNDSPLARVTVTLGTTTGITPVKLADTGKLALGQGVWRISGLSSDTVGSGVIATLPSPTSANTANMIEASTESLVPGSILITLFGEVIGMTTAASLAQGASFYTIANTPAASQ